MQHGGDNAGGQHVDTDPNRNGVGQIPNGFPNAPQPNESFDDQGGSGAPGNHSQAGTTFNDLAQKKGWQSADDMARSYAELEKRFSSGERSPSPQIPQPQPSQGGVQSEDRLRKIEQRLEIEDLSRKYSDVPQFAEAILAKVKESPGILLEDAYKAVKFDAAQKEAREQGVEQGRQEGAQSVEAKFRAATTLPGARNAVPVTSVDEKIKGARTLKDLKEIESALPHA